jgi:hypothetical protein
MDLKIAGKTPGVEIAMVALSRVFLGLSIPWPPMAPKKIDQIQGSSPG